MISNKKMVATCVLATAMAAAPIATHAGEAEVQDPNGIVFLGYTKAEDSWYSYAGAVHALQKGLNKSGALARAVVGRGGYEYESGAFPSINDVDAQILAYQVGLGYQIITERSATALYVSLDYQNHDISPTDRSNNSLGSKRGGAVQLEHTHQFGDMVDLDLIGSRGNINSKYWHRARLGFKVGGIKFGPEIVDMGGNQWDEDRVGAFVSVPVGNGWGVTVAGGHAHSSGRTAGSRSDKGSYGEVGVSFMY